PPISSSAGQTMVAGQGVWPEDRLSSRSRRVRSLPLSIGPAFLAIPLFQRSQAPFELFGVTHADAEFQEGSGRSETDPGGCGGVLQRQERFARLERSGCQHAACPLYHVGSKGAQLLLKLLILQASMGRASADASAARRIFNSRSTRQRQKERL